MSDYLTQLRGDLVDAHARYGQRGRAGRLARPVHPRTWRPATLLAAAAAAACLVLAAVGIRALNGPVPAKLRIVDQVRLGGQPGDAVMGFGYLWVTDFSGSVVQVDPVEHRIVRRIPVGANPSSIAAGAGAVWVTPTGQPNDSGHLVRIDPRTGRVTLRVRIPTGGAAVAADAGRVWLLDTDDAHVGVALWAKRIDPVTGRVLVTLPIVRYGDALALAGDSLWTLTHHGDLVQRDPRTGRAVRSWALAALPARSDTVLAADARGVWVLHGSVVIRVEAGGRVARRIRVPARTEPVIAQDGQALWIAAGGGFPPHYRLLRLAGDAGAVTGSVDLTYHQPQALVPSAQGLWMVGADGTALLVR
jgi:hypothetical protein